jgi:glycerol uptake facilitator-like aquaporin
MKNEKYWDGFILGFFIGGITGIVIYDLVVRGIL